MKGIILAGGLGTRLSPCTLVTNKHLLPVYDRPMIYFPLASLIEAGIMDILLISGPEHSGDFLSVLGNGNKFGCQIEYMIQPEAGGIAQALSLAEKFAEEESVAVILGDNIFSDNFFEIVQNFQEGSHIFLKHITNPKRFGVATLAVDGTVLDIEEKPENPQTDLAVTGFYIYDKTVFNKIREIKPSQRNELEITDVNNFYIQENKMTASVLEGEWTDAGTFESLFLASNLVRSGIVKKALDFN